jgi:hypothetical protein
MNKIYFRNVIQAELFKRELQGQISDGHWEDNITDTRLWYCDVRVVEGKVGIDFEPKHPLEFTDIIGEGLDEELLAIARETDPNYTIGILYLDLRDMTEIIFGRRT